jgi:hypothetical protein
MNPDACVGIFFAQECPASFANTMATVYYKLYLLMNIVFQKGNDTFQEQAGFGAV